ncbi:hypothetical protein ACLB2K_013068 [Fragaria x ananassa]
MNMHRFKILTWNCRGLNNIETQDALVGLIRQHNPSLVFLSETLAAPDLLENVRRRMRLDGVICALKDDNCRGLGLFLRNDVSVRLRHFSDNFIDAEVGEQLQRVDGRLNLKRLKHYNYYENIFRFNGSDSNATATILNSLPTKVAAEMNSELLAPYIDDKIKKALFQMHPSKSPGPD